MRAERVPEEVFPGIFRIVEKGMFSMVRPPVNIYVITGPDGMVYDGGYGNFMCLRQFDRQYREIERICRERGIENRIERILLSHCHADHFSGLNSLRKKYGFRILLTERMASIVKGLEEYRDSFDMEEGRIPEKKKGPAERIFGRFLEKLRYRIYHRFWGISFVDNPDEIISEGSMDINSEKWQVFTSPGHSDDHITLYNMEKGILFSGDNVLRTVNTWLGPPRSDIDLYVDSIREMASLENLKIILPAHGSPVDEPRLRLKQIIDWRWKRTDDVEAFLVSAGREGITVDAIIEKLYSESGKMKKQFARGWVVLTLEKLIREGSAERAAKGRFLAVDI